MILTNGFPENKLVVVEPTRLKNMIVKLDHLPKGVNGFQDRNSPFPFGPPWRRCFVEAAPAVLDVAHHLTWKPSPGVQRRKKKTTHRACHCVEFSSLIVVKVDTLR